MLLESKYETSLLTLVSFEFVLTLFTPYVLININKNINNRYHKLPNSEKVSSCRLLVWPSCLENAYNTYLTKHGSPL